MKKESNQQNPKNTNEQQLFLETRNGNFRGSGKPSTPKAEEGYCNEATQNGPLIHSQSHQAQNTVEHTQVKERRHWTKQKIKEMIWCYMYCKTVHKKTRQSVCTSLFIMLTVQMVFSFLLQHNISKHCKCFSSASEVTKLQHHTTLCTDCSTCQVYP